MKNLSAAASANDDITDKADVASAISTALAAADGTGLTESGGVLSIGANYRSIAIPFYIAGSVTTGVKLAEFIFPVAATVVDMRCRLNAGSGTTTVRPSKNAGTTDGSTQNVTTTSASTAQSLSFAAGDRLTLNVTAVGTTPSDLSVTMWANIT